jgi:hypothetical protein
MKTTKKKCCANCALEEKEKVNSEPLIYRHICSIRFFSRRNNEFIGTDTGRTFLYCDKYKERER